MTVFLPWIPSIRWIKIRRIVDSVQFDVSKLNHILDDERIVDAGRERLTIRTSFDEGFGDDEQVIEDEEMPILDRRNVDDLKHG